MIDGVRSIKIRRTGSQPGNKADTSELEGPDTQQ